MQSRCEEDGIVDYATHLWRKVQFLANETFDRDGIQRKQYQIIDLLREDVGGIMSLCGLVITLCLGEDEDLQELLGNVYPVGETDTPTLESLLHTTETASKGYKLDGLPVSVVGGRHLFHLLAEFNYPLSLAHLLRLGARETPDVAGLLPRDIASRDCRELLLSISTEQVRTPLTHKEYAKVLRDFSVRLISEDRRNAAETQCPLTLSLREHEST